MILSKIKSDEHGLYVRINGGIMRPEKCEHDQHHIKRVFKSKFKEGDEVKLSHITQTPFAKLIKDDITEVWCSHGCYFDGKGKQIDSNKIWNPKIKRTLSKDEYQ